MVSTFKVFRSGTMIMLVCATLCGSLYSEVPPEPINPPLDCAVAYFRNCNDLPLSGDCSDGDGLCTQWGKTCNRYGVMMNRAYTWIKPPPAGQNGDQVVYAGVIACGVAYKCVCDWNADLDGMTCVASDNLDGVPMWQHEYDTNGPCP